MKKLLFVLVFVAVAVTSQAQLFVGGSIGFGHGAGYSEKTVSVDGKVDLSLSGADYSPRTTTFSIAPTVGYMMSDVIGFGATIGFSNAVTKECTNDEKKEFNDKVSASAFTFAPFFRYVFGDFGKIKLYADAKLPLAFGNTKHVYETNGRQIEEKGVSAEYPKTFEIGFFIQPAFTYQFNDHISFNAELGLLSLGWNMEKKSYTDEEPSIKTTTEGYDKNSEFGFGVNKRVPVQFGFVYTF